MLEHVNTTAIVKAIIIGGVSFSIISIMNHLVKFFRINIHPILLILILHTHTLPLPPLPPPLLEKASEKQVKDNQCNNAIYCCQTVQEHLQEQRHICKV